MKPVSKQSLVKSGFNLVKVEHTFPGVYFSGQKILWNWKLHSLSGALLFGFTRILSLTEQTLYASSDFYSTWGKKKINTEITPFFLCLFNPIGLCISSRYFSSVAVINGTLQGAVIKLSSLACYALFICVLKEYCITVNVHEKLYIPISCANKNL